VGPRAGVDAMQKRKMSRPFRKSNPGRPARSLDAILIELSRFRSILRSRFKTAPHISYYMT
jgi:hypothetical protein